MTFREKLADWISGGKLTEARAQQIMWQRDWKAMWCEVRDIWYYTRHQKSGTAKKVARMCERALK